MQTQEMKQNSRDILLPVPAELMEEAGLCASDVIQYYATPGKLVIEAIRDPELLQEVYGDAEEAEAGDCSGCPFREGGT